MEENNIRRSRGIFITIMEYAKFEPGHVLTLEENELIRKYARESKRPKYYKASSNKFPQKWPEGWYYAILYEHRTGRLIKAIVTGGVDEFDDGDEILYFGKTKVTSYLAILADSPVGISGIKIDGNAAIMPDGWRYIKYSWKFPTGVEPDVTKKKKEPQKRGWYWHEGWSNTKLLDIDKKKRRGGGRWY